MILLLHRPCAVERKGAMQLIVSTLLAIPGAVWAVIQLVQWVADRLRSRR